MFCDTHTVRSATTVAAISESPSINIRSFSFNPGTFAASARHDPCIVRNMAAGLFRPQSR